MQELLRHLRCEFFGKEKRPSVEHLRALEGCFACHICAMVKGKHSTFGVSFVCRLSFLETG